jgi:hypothetical protein
MLDLLSEEQKREAQRAKELQKLSDPVEKEKLELKFDQEKTKTKQKLKAMTKKHAEELAKLEGQTPGAKKPKESEKVVSN